MLKRGRRSEALSVAMTSGTAHPPSDSRGPQQTPRATGIRNLGLRQSLRPTHPRRSIPRIHRFWNNVTWRRPEDAEGIAAAVVRDWLRFEPTTCFDDPFIDTTRPLILLDTFGWPAVYEQYQGADYTAPNLDISVNFHRSAAESEWLLGDHECPIADDGLLGVSGRVWNEGGRLLATGVAALLHPASERGLGSSAA